MDAADEIRAITARVKELRQELESVEARLREVSGDGALLAPIEPVDSPTVLTTRHAQRRARTERMMPIVAACGAVVVLTGGIAIGYALRPAAPAPAMTPVATTMAPPPATAPVEPVEPVEPAPPETVALPSAVPAVPPPSVSASAIPVRPTAIPTKKVDYGF